MLYTPTTQMHRDCSADEPQQVVVYFLALSLRKKPRLLYACLPPPPPHLPSLKWSNRVIKRAHMEWILVARTGGAVLKTFGSGGAGSQCAHRAYLVCKQDTEKSPFGP